MRYGLDDLAITLHKKHSDMFNLDEVKALLAVPEGYAKDTPISTGKKLMIKRLFFSGKKSNGDAIHFDESFDNGLNVIIADNLKGKSSLFKIMKFALTGENSLKHDIKKWITAITLDFDICEREYAVNVEMNKGRCNSVLSTRNASSDVLFEAKGIDE
jgi:hypothetical protein